MSDTFLENTLRLMGDILGLNSNPISQKGTKGSPIRKDMFRLDLSHKGPGFLGDIPMTGEFEGSHMSEVSRGLPGHPDGFYPMLVPGTPPETIERVRAGGEWTQEDEQRAKAHNDLMVSQGLSPFAPGGYKPEDYSRQVQQKPEPLTPMGQDEVDQLGAQMQNVEVARMLSRPGAMVLDTPLGRPRTEDEMTADFERSGKTQRPGKVLQSHELPKGALTTRRIGAKP
jgi:hypothetical protein